MFERYDEAARRVLFFARSEVTRSGGTTIETEHLLLGLLRDPSIAQLLTEASVSLESIRREVEERRPTGEKLGLSAEIPFSAEAKRILWSVGEDADRLGHNYIGPGHLLLALLREEGGTAAEVLRSRGVTYDNVRQAIAARPSEQAWVSVEPVPMFEEVDRIIEWTNELARLTGEGEAREIVQRIRDGLDALRRRLVE